MNAFEYSLIGEGEINVIFLNGFRMHFNSWDKVYPQVAQSNKVLLVNRGGIGLSPKAQLPQTGKVIIDSLKNTFTLAGVEPPYVLVSHSLGGIFANLYARTFPTEVAGVVFVESPHPLEIREQKKFKPPFLLRAINDGIKAIEKVFDPYKFSEDEAIHETLRQIDAAGNFPNVPISVVTGTKKMPFVPQGAFDIHMQFQAKLLELSNRSKHFICTESGHFPQITEGDIVIAAIEHNLELIRNSV